MEDGLPKNSEQKMRIRDENYYEVLGCSEKASPSELKQNYQNLIKKYHPDKNVDSPLSSDRFVLIDKAYKTLKDEKLRKEYDATLLENCFNDNSLIYAELLKKDLIFNEEGLAHFTCRCGEDFKIEKEYLDEEECIVECSECTNCILIR